MARNGTVRPHNRPHRPHALAPNLADPFDAPERTAATIVFAAHKLGNTPAPTCPEHKVDTVQLDDPLSHIDPCSRE